MRASAFRKWVLLGLLIGIEACGVPRHSPPPSETAATVPGKPSSPSSADQPVTSAACPPFPELHGQAWITHTLNTRPVRVLEEWPALPQVLPHPMGRFLDVMFQEATTEPPTWIWAELDRTGTAHRFHRTASPRGFCPLADAFLCWGPTGDWGLNWDPQQGTRNRFPDGRRLVLDPWGGLQMEERDGTLRPLHNPTPLYAAYALEAGWIIGIAEDGTLWRRDPHTGSWEGIRKPDGESLRGLWMLPAPTPQMALAVEVVSLYRPPTPTPRPPRLEPGGQPRTPTVPAAPVPIPPWEPVAFHLWRVPLAIGRPPELQARFPARSVASDRPLPRPVTLVDGRHGVLYWTFGPPETALPESHAAIHRGSSGELINLLTGQRVREEELGLPSKGRLVDVEAPADGQWVAGTLVDPSTGEAIGLWLAPGSAVHRGRILTGWQGVQAWGSQNGMAVVRRGPPASPGELGLVRLEPAGEPRPLKGARPPVAFTAGRVVVIDRDHPTKVVAWDGLGQERDRLDLSGWAEQVEAIIGLGEAVILVVSKPESSGCRYRLVEWYPK